MDGFAFVDGIEVVNATPHEIRFEMITGDIVVVPPSGFTLKAVSGTSTVSSNPKFNLVKTTFSPSEEGKEEIKEIKRLSSTGSPIIVGSIISAQAFGPDVVSLVPVAGTERNAPQDKRFYSNVFNVFE